MHTLQFPRPAACSQLYKLSILRRFGEVLRKQNDEGGIDSALKPI